MMRTAFFMNIGRRNPLIQNELVLALMDKILQVLDLDVFETEPLPENSPLWALKSVIITPHFMPNLKNYLNGKTPSTNLLDYKKGY